jgi:penicillin-binding protein 2
LGIDRLASYFQQFGLGQKTGVDLPGEVSGLVPTPTWKQGQYTEKWFIGDTYHTSIGQGYLLVTPLQLANAIAAIANGGTVWHPSLAAALVDPITGVETPLAHTSTTQQVIDAKNLKVVREGMRETVLTGSGRPLNTLKVTSAGKTGTAQFGNQGLLNAWYTGFAPYENPQYAFAVLIEGGGESFYSSVPVTEEILRGIFNEPLEPGKELSAHTNVPAEFTGER